MLTPGDVVELDLGAPTGSEAGLRRPAIVVTAQRILLGDPNVVQVIPLTRTIRDSGTEIPIDPDEDNGLNAPCAAQCQHIRSVATSRVHRRLGNVGPVILRQVRSIVGVILDT